MNNRNPMQNLDTLSLSHIPRAPIFARVCKFWAKTIKHLTFIRQWESKNIFQMLEIRSLWCGPTHQFEQAKKIYENAACIKLPGSKCPYNNIIPYKGCAVIFSNQNGVRNVYYYEKGLKTSCYDYGQLWNTADLNELCYDCLYYNRDGYQWMYTWKDFKRHILKQIQLEMDPYKKQIRRAFEMDGIKHVPIHSLKGGHSYGLVPELFFKNIKITKKEFLEIDMPKLWMARCGFK